MIAKICSPKYCTEDVFKKIVTYSCVNQLFNASVSQYGSMNAFVDCSTLTFRDVGLDVASFRGVIKSRGIKRGDRVGIYAPNSYGFIRAFFAITTLGAVAVLIPIHLSETEVVNLAKEYNLTALVCESFTSGEYINILEKSDTQVLGVDTDSSEPCAIMFTAGTTGKSKAVLLSHRAITYGTVGSCFGLREVFNQRYLHVIPMTHVFGLIRSVLLSFYTGSCLFICKNTKNMFKDMATFKPTVVVLVPALAELALNLSKQFKRNMLGSDARFVYCGAAYVSSYLVEEYNKLGITLYPGYGLTESATLVAGNPEPLYKPESVGLIYDGVETKVVDGELWIKGLSLMDCYVNNSEENEKSFSDGWFKTGDLVRFDDEGFLYITGRKKELIILSNGENVSPAELEAKFNAIDCIQDSLVYASNENGHEILALQVYPRIAVLKELKIDDVDYYVRQRIDKINKSLPSFMQVSKVIIRSEDFVRGPSLKIVRGKNGEK